MSASNMIYEAGKEYVHPQLQSELSKKLATWSTFNLDDWSRMRRDRLRGGDVMHLERWPELDLQPADGSEAIPDCVAVKSLRFRVKDLVCPVWVCEVGDDRGDDVEHAQHSNPDIKIQISIRSMTILESLMMPGDTFDDAIKWLYDHGARPSAEQKEG